MYDTGTVIYEFQPNRNQKFKFFKGEEVKIINSKPKKLWTVQKKDGRQSQIPSNCVKITGKKHLTDNFSINYENPTNYDYEWGNSSLLSNISLQLSHPK